MIGVIQYCVLAPILMPASQRYVQDPAEIPDNFAKQL
jgi:hypothetical protein